MSTKNTYAQLSMEQLKKREKAAKIMIIMQVVALLIMVVTGIVTSYRKGFGVFSFFFMFFVPMLVGGILSLRQIRKEIKSREVEEAMF